jgi:hypothetical protein
MLRLKMKTVVLLMFALAGAVYSCKQASYEIVNDNNEIRRLQNSKFRVEGPTSGKTNQTLTYHGTGCGESNEGKISWVIIETDERKEGFMVNYTFPNPRVYTLEATCEYFPQEPIRLLITITDGTNPGQNGNQNQNKN